ncbi:CoA transferase [Streptomyces sp. NPDC057074]|uniref:CoA transferase n=1 Tax=Streptomyces sp. NPDC057074 TaxID=3346015 RepID=UPI00362EB24B
MTSPAQAPSAPHAELPLVALRVLDLTEETGELTSRILGDLGALVVRVELRHGGNGTAGADPARGPHPDLRHETMNFNKRNVVLDPAAPEARETLLRLVAGCDIVVDGLGSALRDVLGLTPRGLRRRFPTLVVVSLSDFGDSGPYRDWVATDAVHAAMSGMLSRSGLPGRPPLLPPGSLPRQSAAVSAAWAALLAYCNRLQTGAGDTVELSVFESAVQVLDPGYGMAGSATGGVPTSDGPRDRPDVGHLYPIFRCSDGYVRLCVLSPRQWQGVFRWMGEPEEFADPSLGQMRVRHAAAGILMPAIGRMLASKTRDQAVAEAQALGVPAAALLDLGETTDAAHYTAREAFTTVTTGTGPVRVANGLMYVDGVRAGLRSPAPVRGTTDSEVLDGLPELDDHPEGTVIPLVPRRPFEGLRVLDLGVIVAGGEAGRLFADMGADVIKVENSVFPDGSRQSLTGAPISPVFAWGHRNKRSIGLNLREPRGRDLLKQLVTHADVLLSNFRPGTLDKLGLTADELRALNPRLVIGDSSAFGADGPWSDRLGYGPLVRASTGLSLLWRYPDDQGGGFCDASTIYPDHVVARLVAIGVVAQLLRRQRTGRGGTVSVSQAEVILGQNAVVYAAESLAVSGPAPLADGRTADAPRGVYPCAGDDEWIVAEVRDDADWARLAEVIGGPATDERFRTRAGRLDHRAALDAIVAAWTGERRPYAAARELQSAGVPAGPMRRLPDLLKDEHLCAREAFRTAVHPLLEQPLPSENTPAHFDNVPDVEHRPAPLLGQQTREIAAGLLGLDATEIERLLTDGVLEETLPPEAEPPRRASGAGTGAAPVSGPDRRVAPQPS